MGYANDKSVGDFEKLQIAFREVSSKFGSVDGILEAFGLTDMPAAQRYGILFGCIVFFLTITAVVCLLTLGGSFKRIAEQAETGEATLLSAAEARQQRSLLLERLLEGRERMVRNYPDPPTTDKPTSLTKMMLNEAPDSPLDPDDVADDENNDSTNTKKKKNKNKATKDTKKPRYIPPFYEENYIMSYRKCQDKPGGAVLSGRPEARFEAYARGFAGCGPYMAVAYRRSYGRMYEALSCMNHATDEKYTKLFKERPHDIIGKYVRLEALDVERHLEDVFKVTSGEPALENKSYDPQEVWGFLEDGPFDDEKEMHQSFVFQRKQNEAGFAIVHAVTNRVMGVVLLRHDDPRNLTIQLEAPMMQPSREGSKEQLEACYLLIDRLYAYGYRRIQVSIDNQDAEKRKMCTRLGFTLEGVLYKHMVVKEASRDSNVYGMLNSDWQRGARSAVFKKLHSVAALRADQTNEKAEEEFDEQTRVLKEQKKAEEAATKNKKV